MKRLICVAAFCAAVTSTVGYAGAHGCRAHDYNDSRGGYRYTEFHHRQWPHGAGARIPADVDVRPVRY